MILEGVMLQTGNFKSLTIQDNEVDEKCVRSIVELASRRLPDQLDQLHIMSCRIGWTETEMLLKGLRSC